MRLASSCVAVLFAATVCADEPVLLVRNGIFRPFQRSVRYAAPCPVPAVSAAAASATPSNVSTTPLPAPVVEPRATIDGTGLGWRTLTLADFEHVNCDPDTWSEVDGIIHCTGKPVGVVRSKQQVGNLELVAEWRHLSSGGNSGIFLWAPEAAFADIQPGRLPRGGIEIQILDHGFTEKYEKSSGKKGDWFTTNGDVFPVGTSKMNPFEPKSPNGSRSFPRKNLSKGTPEWNHYYVRAINGEVRLWVNGEEVSGGNECDPRSGHICLESEGAPVEFRNIRIRELP